MRNFSVSISKHFDRDLRRLVRRQREAVSRYAEVITVLKSDPYNTTGAYHIKKLEGVSHGSGQYRLRISRFRFRYDIFGEEVVLHSCGLRREDTYR